MIDGTGLKDVTHGKCAHRGHSSLRHALTQVFSLFLRKLTLGMEDRPRPLLPTKEQSVSAPGP